MTTPPECRFDDKLYGADPEEVLALLGSLGDDVEAAMVVGHNPTAHSLSQGLISPRDKKGLALAVRTGFPTCALGVYSFKAGTWADVAAGTGKLVALMVPPYG
jgi:phosphohistidine phosphatase